ncbi:hypothetical protein TNCV_549611 [Trichonephila clavipes]|nr:hypothetical protein TNCV_549611 [Trichonephila clavipes]
MIVFRRSVCSSKPSLGELGSFEHSANSPRVALQCDVVIKHSLRNKSAILKSSIDIEEEHMMANVEFETVTTIVSGLKQVKDGLEKLCSRNGT